jgi:hypothetical protein
MFGRGGTTARMRGRNDGGAQKRKVLVTVCTLVLMFSLVSLYHGSFFSNRSNKGAVEDTFDPSASGWGANLAKGESVKARESTGVDLSSNGNADAKAVQEADANDVEATGGEKDVFSEKIEGNEEDSLSDGDSPKTFPVSATGFWILKDF